MSITGSNHIIIHGETGSGKTVLANRIIESVTGTGEHVHIISCKENVLLDEKILNNGNITIVPVKEAKDFLKKVNNDSSDKKYFLFFENFEEEKHPELESIILETIRDNDPKKVMVTIVTTDNLIEKPVADNLNIIKISTFYDTDDNGEKHWGYDIESKIS